MPLFKCTKCHHEWEGIKKDNKCSWCKAKGRIIEKETAFEKACKRNAKSELNKPNPQLDKKRKK